MRLILLTFCIFAAAACGGPSLTGRAPSGTSEVEAVDGDGNSFPAVLEATQFRIDLKRAAPIELFVLDADGVRRVMKYPPVLDAEPTESIVPPFEGTVLLAQLSHCDCDHDGEDHEVTPENNPLEHIDADHDGAPALEDHDDGAHHDVAQHDEPQHADHDEHHDTADGDVHHDEASAGHEVDGAGATHG